MANPQKQKKRFIAISGTGKRQAAKGTAMADDDIDTRINCTYVISDVVQRETVYDCAQTDIYDETDESRYKKIVITFNAVTVQLISIFTAYFLSASAASVVSGSFKKHLMTRSTDDALAGFGFIEGFEGDTTKAQKYKDFKVDSISFGLNRRKNVTMTVTAYGHFQTEDVGDEWVEPACSNPTALKSKDCKLSINATDLSALLWTMGVNLNNSVPTGDDPFPWNSIDIDDFERGEKPTYPLTAQILGSKGDTQYTEAEAGTKRAVVLQLGSDTDPHMVYTFPNVMQKLADPPTVFVGEVNKSAINMDMTPHIDGTLQAPLKAEAYISQSTAFLTT